MGRWVSRDPIEEQGGINVYEFVQNAPEKDVDPFGLSVCNTTSQLLSSYVVSQNGPSFVRHIYNGVIDYKQNSVPVFIIVLPSGGYYVNQPTDYICKCSCAKQVQHWKRNVTCKKYRETT